MPHRTGGIQDPVWAQAHPPCTQGRNQLLRGHSLARERGVGKLYRPLAPAIAKRRLALCPKNPTPTSAPRRWAGRAAVQKSVKVYRLNRNAGVVETASGPACGQTAQRARGFGTHREPNAGETPCRKILQLAREIAACHSRGESKLTQPSEMRDFSWTAHSWRGVCIR